MKKKRIKIQFKTLIGSLFIAFILWVYVVLSKNYETSIKIPVLIKNVPEDKALADKIPDNVSAIISGQGKNLLLFKYFLKSDINFVIDFSQNHDRKVISQKDFQKWIKIPRGFSGLIDFEFKSPDKINLNLEKKMTKKVPVSTENIEFLTTEGYYTYIKKIKPDSVFLSGPIDIVRDINKINTESINYAGKKRSFTDELKLNIPDVISSDINKTKIFVEVNKIEKN